MRGEFGLYFKYILSVKCQKCELLADLSVLEENCLHFSAVFHQVFKKGLLLLEKFCDIIVWGTLEEMK